MTVCAAVVSSITLPYHSEIRSSILPATIRSLRAPDVSDSLPQSRNLIVVIMLALVAWGVFHAVGAWRLNYDPRRAAVVLACTAVFIGFWLVMLWTQRKRA